MTTEAIEKETACAKVGLSSAKRAFERFVIRFRGWRERRRAKRLYRKICEANYIILRELHGNKYSRPYRADLESCADVLELAACNVKCGFSTDV